MKHTLSSAALIAVLAGCAAQQPMIWARAWPGGNPLQQDAAQCDYETSAATQTTDYSYKTGFGQELDRAMRKGDLSVQCMRAKGWNRVPAGSANADGSIENGAALTESVKPLLEEANAMCAKPELRPIFAKSSCDASAITAFQMSDQSHILEYEKPLFSQWRAQVGTLNQRQNIATRKYAAARGDRVAQINEASEATLEVSSDALLADTMTWGQYNTKRKALAASKKTDAMAVANGR